MSRVVLVLVFASLAACKKGGDRADQAPVTSGGSSPGVGDTGNQKGDPTGSDGFGRGRNVISIDGDFEAVGAVDKDTVRKVVKDNVTKLQTCYEQTLMANPNIAGTVTATFTVDNGSVTNIKASGVHPDVESCVIKAVQLFKFPPGGKVDVTYPFTFKPAS